MLRILTVIILVACAVPARAADLAAIAGAFERTAATFPGRTGMAFIDLSTNRRVARNGDTVFESASVAKVPILLEVYRQAAEGRLRLDDTVPLKDAHKAGGSGILKDQPAGTRWKISRLAELMVTISDNTATNMVQRRIGDAAINQRLAGMGLRTTRIRRLIMDFAALDAGRDNLTTPGETARMLGVIARTPGDAPVIEVLKKQKRRHMIPALLPKEAVVASKTGELSGVVNDVGIVYTPRGAYVLALFSIDTHDAPAAYKAWRELSLTVYKAYLR